MTGPPIKRSAPELRITGAVRNLRLTVEYHLLCLVQAPFEFVFWALEQRKGRLADKLANEWTWTSHDTGTHAGGSQGTGPHSWTCGVSSAMTASHERRADAHFTLTSHRRSQFSTRAKRGNAMQAAAKEAPLISS